MPIEVKDKTQKDIIKAIGSGLIVFSVSYLFKTLYDYSTGIALLFQISTIFSAIIYFTSRSRYRIFIFSIYFVIEGYIFSLLEKDNILDVIRSDNKVFRMIENVYQGNGYNEGKHEIILICMLIFILCILVRVCIQFFISRVITSVGLSAVMVILGINNRSVPKLVLFILILFILCVLMEICTEIKSNHILVEQRKILNIYLIPLCVIIAFVTINIPSKEEPIRFKFARNISNSISDKWKMFSDYYDDIRGNWGEFGVNFTGYSENNTVLGGKLVNDNTLVMEVKPDKPLKSTLFLTGSVKNIYTGNSWQNSDLPAYEGYDEYFLDYMELICSLSRNYQQYYIQMTNNTDDLNNITTDTSQMNPSEVFMLMEENRKNTFNPLNIDIIYKDIKTRSLFYPLKTYIIDTKDFAYKYSADNAGILFDKSKKSDTNYKSYFYEMNINTLIKTIIKDNDSFSYKNYNSSSDTVLDYRTQESITQNFFNDLQYYPNLTEPEFFQLLDERSRDIQKNYTTLPVELPNRVYELAETITKGYSTKYDKAKSIEKYFEDMPYTLTPEIVPKDRDFVDYFLFDSKEGYCTYYATAMAVLGRCIGLPTRYVEGFSIKSSERVAGYYQVRNKDAHAWVEVYFEGVGWIPFEPTPGMSDERYAYGEKEINNSAESESPPEETPIPTEPIPPINAAENSNKDTTQIEENKIIANIKPIHIIIATLLLLIILTEAIIIWRQYTRYKRLLTYSQKTNKEKAKIIYGRILKYYKQQGLIMNSNETTLDFTNRVYKNHTFGDMKFCDVSNIFMKARYSKSIITDDELMYVDTFAHRLKESTANSN